MDKPQAKHWMDNPAFIIHGTDPDKDILDLETRAAVNQYHHKLPKGDAEARAYAEHKRDYHAKAAAHHLRGMKAAQGSGDTEQVKRHTVLYDLHMKELGHDTYGAIPEEVKRHATGDHLKPMYAFKAHPGDAFVLHNLDQPAPVQKTEPVDNNLQKALGDLYLRAKLLVTMDELKKGDIIPFPGNPAPAVSRQWGLASVNHLPTPAPKTTSPSAPHDPNFDPLKFLMDTNGQQSVQPQPPAGHDYQSVATRGTMFPQMGRMIGADFKSGKSIFDYSHMLSPTQVQNGYSIALHHRPGGDGYMEAALNHNGQPVAHKWAYPYAAAKSGFVSSLGAGGGGYGATLQSGPIAQEHLHGSYSLLQALQTHANNILARRSNAPATQPTAAPVKAAPVTTQPVKPATNVTQLPTTTHRPGPGRDGPLSPVFQLRPKGPTNAT